MQPNRRDFLRLGLGTSSLLACGATVPAFLANSARAVAGTKARGRILVVLELNGGNDGLNTVVPHRDDEYHKRRPRLRLTADRLHKVDDRTGLHPALRGLSHLLQQRQLAIVQSVGYPNPNRSHFESMAIWQAARLKARGDASGWLARCLDARRAPPRGDAPAFNISSALLPQASARPPARAAAPQGRRGGWGASRRPFPAAWPRGAGGGGVWVWVFSESGRRRRENAGAGPARGPAARVFRRGGVKPGLPGPYPNL